VHLRASAVGQSKIIIFARGLLVIKRLLAGSAGVKTQSKPPKDARSQQ
jgi:hypothetical protein